ncbi:MAG: hypothetical protein AB1646_18520 [Thermodesulfobacteriota bacterium]
MAKFLGSIAAMMVIVAVVASPAPAYEFNLTATYYWNYYAEHQMGNKGFFGTYDVDNGGMVAANQNFWGGINRLSAGVFSGANAIRQTQYMDFSPEFRINQAVRVRGTYRVGSWSPTGAPVPASSEYDNSLFPGTTVSHSPGYWNSLWLTAQTPWGILALGKRPFSLGIGTFLNGEDNTTTEAVLLHVPYGPFNMGLAFYAARNLVDVQPPFSRHDGVNHRSPDAGAFITYSACNLEIGAFYDYLRWSLGPESQGGTTPAARQTAHDQFIGRDLLAQWGIAFLKYNNGRFFFNTEFDYFYSKVTNQPNVTGTDWAGGAPFVSNVPGWGSVYRPKYTEMERYAIETGVFVGPAKVSLMGARIPGFDRRHGVLIDKQPNGLWVGPENHPGALIHLHPELSNTGFFNPYTYLMVWSYGGGTGTLNSNLDGQLVDANAVGGRLDYAVAANLNLWGSLFYAERTSHAYGWGFIAPDGNGSVTYTALGTGATPSPSIPDRALGYEFGGGLDWALLEGLRFNTRVAYWLPGKWFNYACRSRENPGWATPGPDNNWGIQPNRTIDSVFGLQMQVIGEF